LENSLFLTQTYDYALDDSYIATHPAHPKDSAKLLVYHRKSGTITHTTFAHLLEFLPPDAALLLNDTKVIKARLYGHKKSGGAIELLLNSPQNDNRFLVYIKGRVKVGTQLLFDEDLTAQVEALHKDGTRSVTFWQGDTQLDFVALEAILARIGHLPLPPYIKRADTLQDTQDYQTLFAQNIGAVAAPTASLHFTPELLEATLARHAHAFVTLHVGAGTFKPVEHEDIRHHTMHSEVFALSDEAKKLIDSPVPIIAVGTTVTRTVEYYVRTQEHMGQANLFLHPHNPPQRVNHLITNFHLPKSTLLMLVASFVGVEKTLALYEEAKRQNYRFFSYGDAMLIL